MKYDAGGIGIDHVVLIFPLRLGCREAHLSCVIVPSSGLLASFLHFHFLHFVSIHPTSTSTCLVPLHRPRAGPLNDWEGERSAPQDPTRLQPFHFARLAPHHTCGCFRSLLSPPTHCQEAVSTGVLPDHSSECPTESQSSVPALPCSTPVRPPAEPRPSEQGSQHFCCLPEVTPLPWSRLPPSAHAASVCCPRAPEL